MTITFHAYWIPLIITILSFLGAVGFSFSQERGGYFDFSVLGDVFVWMIAMIISLASWAVYGMLK